MAAGAAFRPSQKLPLQVKEEEEEKEERYYKNEDMKLQLQVKEEETQKKRMNKDIVKMKI